MMVQRFANKIRQLVMVMPFILIFGGCEADSDTVSYRLNKNAKLLTITRKCHEKKFQQVEEVMKVLLTSADNRYRMVISPKLIQRIRSNLYAEIVFAEQQDILIQPIGVTKIKVKKILLGMQDDFGWSVDGSCNILYGDPDYGEYNIVVRNIRCRCYN